MGGNNPSRLASVRGHGRGQPGVTHFDKPVGYLRVLVVTQDRGGRPNGPVVDPRIVDLIAAPHLRCAEEVRPEVAIAVVVVVRPQVAHQLRRLQATFDPQRIAVIYLHHHAQSVPRPFGCMLGIRHGLAIADLGVHLREIPHPFHHVASPLDR